MAKRKTVVPRVEACFYLCPDCLKHGWNEEGTGTMMMTRTPASILCDVCKAPLLRSVVAFETLQMDRFLDYLELMGCLPTLPKKGGAA